jgi:hypothetical protein
MSLAGHGLLLGLILLQTVPTTPAPETQIRISLLKSEALKSDVTSEAQEKPVPSTAKSSSEELLESTKAESTAPPRQTEVASMSTVARTQLWSRLRDQLPQVVQDLSPRQPPTPTVDYQVRSNPKLPSRGPSLFDQWMGPVKPSLDRWAQGSGEVSARVTLASGDIVCIHRRAPTTAELFNPWASLAIPMSRVCGKARREAVDLSDPWLRSRPQSR